MKKRSEVMFVLCILVVVFAMRSFPFFQHEIPLGYDPGLYRSMFLAYHQLGAFWQFDLLPARIQSIYEPLLGMRGSLFGMIMGGRSDSVLTRGWAIVSFLPILGIRLLGNTYSRRVGIFSLLLAVGSYTQWSIFWRAYRKQAIGMFLVCVLLRGRSKMKRRAMIPVLVASCLVTRSTIVLMCLIGIGYMLLLLVRKDKQWLGLFGSALVSGLLVMPVVVPLRHELFLPMVSSVFSQIALPGTTDLFQAGGTFLTIYEYFIVGGGALLLAVWGRLYAPKQNAIHLLCAGSFLLLLVWVFFQFFFFQRMLGYLDMFVLVYAAGGLARLWSAWGNSGKGIAVACILLHFSIGTYRIQRTYRPLIEPQEFAFLSQISTSLEDNAIIIVPGIDYSPRVQGWTQREVLAPGLFDLNRRGGLDQQRDHSRYAASGHQKCTALMRDYPTFRDHPVYLWIGSKQPSTSLDGSCFHLLETGQGRSWRAVRL